jgi:peptidoglycan/xylan/chitin deacetylase (PgdA/CDA1 family)
MRLDRSNETPLTVSLVHQGTLYDDLLAELLEQQGVPFKTVLKEDEAHRGPVALISKSTPEARLRATESCSGKKENVLIGEEIVNLETILYMLGGLQDNKKDNFDLPVNEEGRKLVVAVGKRMSEIGLPLVLKSTWPKGAKACCVLTHDIDFMSFSPFHKVVLRGFDHPSRLMSLLYNGAVRRTNYGWNIPETIDLEKRYGFRSTFLFMNRYEARDEAYFERSLKLVRDGGSEIALHGSESSHKTDEAMDAEMEAFRERAGFYPRGLRHHILKFQAPETWVIENKFGLEYDATFGYNRFFGFRAGSCFPFHPFTAKERIPILELPTGFMDWTALHRSDDSSKFGEFLQLAKRRVEEFHGALVVNFHNTYLNKETFPFVIEEYESLLRDVREKGYWVATAAECATWWRRRSLEQIEPRLLDDGTILVYARDVSARTFDAKDTSRLRYLEKAPAPPNADSTA